MIPMRAVAGFPAARGTVGNAQAREAYQPRPARQPDARWSLLLGCVSVYLLTAVGRVHQLWPAVGAARPVLLSAALALVCVVLDQEAVDRLRAALREPALRWQLWLLLWAFLSVPLALYPRAALEVSTDLLKSLLMVLAVATAVRGPRDVHRLGWMFFVSIAVFAIYVLTHFEVDQVLARYGKLIYYDANEFALLAVVSLPFGAYAVWSARKAWRRIAVIACMALICMGFVYCGSRGGTLALAVGLVLALIRLDVVKLRWRLASLATIALAFTFTASDQLWERFNSVVDTEDDYNFTAPTGRIEVWKRGIGYMLDRPVLGVGAGNFPIAEGMISSYAAVNRSGSRGYKWSAAHNSFVQVGAELGLPGLVFFLMSLVSAVRSMSRIASAKARATTDPTLVALSYACLLSIACFCTGATFLSLAYSDMLFTLMAIALAITMVVRRMAPRPSPRLA